MLTSPTSCRGERMPLEAILVVAAIAEVVGSPVPLLGVANLIRSSISLGGCLEVQGKWWLFGGCLWVEVVEEEPSSDVGCRTTSVVSRRNACYRCGTSTSDIRSKAVRMVGSVRTELDPHHHGPNLLGHS